MNKGITVPALNMLNSAQWEKKNKKKKKKARHNTAYHHLYDLLANTEMEAQKSDCQSQEVRAGY